MTEPNLTNAKLILLYIVKEFPGIPSAELMDHAIGSLYMDYFSYIQALEDLRRDRLLIRSVRKNESHRDASHRPIERCDITPEGESVLAFLLPKMPAGIRAYLSTETANRRKDDRRESSVIADYSIDATGSYRVQLVLSDGSRNTAELFLSAPDEKTAKEMCRRWKESTADIYAQLLRSLSS
ncbi:MAG: DUF4364 family protein [Clostridiales bacterium]|nr:DUF4364 family protein [Clostridiales bacterium]